MITNWDIISHSTSAADSRSFTLVIDGTENDARLIAKKLAGYVQDPAPAQPPFTFAFALPSDLDEDTLDKIRTAVREGTAQANKVNEFVPGGVLGNPLFNGSSDSSANTPAAQDVPATPSEKQAEGPSVDLNPEDSFLREDNTPAASLEEVFQDPDDATPEKTPSPGITVSDKDMLIKDMEDTLLGKMPLEDIFSAETKYDMFLDVENQALTQNAQTQRGQKIDALAKEVAKADDAFNIFDQKLKEQTNVMDLDDLNTITDNLPGKDKLNQPAATDLPDNLSVHSVNPTEEDTTTAEQPDPSSHTIPEEMVLGNTVPPYGNTSGKTTSGQDGLPDIAVRGENLDVLEKTFNLETTLSTELIRNQYEKSFRDNTLSSSLQELRDAEEKKRNQQHKQKKKKKSAATQKIVEHSHARTVREQIPAQLRQNVPPSDTHGAEELAENTQNIPLQQSAQTAPGPQIAAPAPQPPAGPEEGKTTLRLRLKPQPAAPMPPAPQAPVPPAPQKPHLTLKPKPAPVAPAAPMPEPPAAPGKTRLVLPTPVATPQAPVAPAPAEPTLAQPLAFAQEPAPETPTPATPASAPKPIPSAEKTKTIDYSIELPLSELKKHNWPLEVPLLPTYTLENFVLSVNRFAHATAISVIDNPGKMYNPLVFHGATGTGKTHFLNALAYGFSKKYGQENIFMTNGVRLSRGIQRYVMEGNIEKFEKFMDSVKVLLIDDIHLLAINEQNRAHISKLLNKFLKEQKQIVITSKYPPESLEKLENLIQFHLDSGWISELKAATGQAHFKIVKTMLLGNGVDLNDAQISQFFGGAHMTLSTIMRSIRRLKVLENLVFPNLDENERSQADMFEKLLATTGEDPNSELLAKDPSSITSISTVGNGEWGRLGFFYPANSSNSMNWMVYALEQRAKELGISGGFDIAVRSSYSTENIISSAFKIANLCDNKKLRGAVILGPALTVCEPSVRENFYDILTHMLEIMLIRCGIINAESLRLPSTYVKVISELLR